MRRIRFSFFARILLLSLSAVSGLLSFATDDPAKEIGYAIFSVAAAMLVGFTRPRRTKKHRAQSPVKRPLPPP